MVALLKQRRRQVLERAVQLEASPIPETRMPVPWRLVIAGVVVGLGLGQLQQLVVRTKSVALPAAAPAPVEQRCRFKLPPLNPADLDPVITPEQQARINSWLGPQLPKPAVPAQPQPASSSSDAC